MALRPTVHHQIDRRSASEDTANGHRELSAAELRLGIANMEARDSTRRHDGAEAQYRVNDGGVAVIVLALLDDQHCQGWMCITQPRRDDASCGTSCAVTYSQ